MYELHIANRNYSSWSLRPWLLMRELRIAFSERMWLFEPGSNLGRFRSFSPSGRVPCLVDGASTVWDSLAIVEYLAERHQGVWPAATAARAFARSAACEMHSGFGELRNRCSMSCGVRVRMHAITPALAEDVARIDALWRDGLDRFGGPWLGGDAFTAVDAFFAPVAFRVQTYGLPLGNETSGYVARLLALPGMREWYAAALRETAREPMHEADVAQAGTIVEDLRAPPSTSVA